MKIIKSLGTVYKLYRGKWITLWKLVWNLKKIFVAVADTIWNITATDIKIETRLGDRAENFINFRWTTVSWLPLKSSIQLYIILYLIHLIISGSLHIILRCFTLILLRLSGFKDLSLHQFFYQKTCSEKDEQHYTFGLER